MLSKEQVISAGGKEWSKGEIERVYVKSSTIKTLINYDEECKKDCYFEKNSAQVLKRLDKDGAWFNVKTSKFESKKTSVQTWLESLEISN